MICSVKPKKYNKCKLIQIVLLILKVVQAIHKIAIQVIHKVISLLVKKSKNQKSKKNQSKSNRKKLQCN